MAVICRPGGTHTYVITPLQQPQMEVILSLPRTRCVAGGATHFHPPRRCEVHERTLKFVFLGRGKFPLCEAAQMFFFFSAIQLKWVFLTACSVKLSGEFGLVLSR